MAKKGRALETLSWEEARPQISSVNEELCRVIDEVGPSKKDKLIKASYLYGDLIIDRGTAFLPSKSGDLVPITSDDIDTQIKNDLSYSHIPLLLTLQNGNEVFLDNGSRIVPLNFFYPGSLLGLFEVVDAIFSRKTYSKWSISSGSRSIFTLPKISEKTAFGRLRKHYSLSSNAFPKNMIDHWGVFKEIAQHPNFTQKWHNEVIFFPKSWLLGHKKNLKWEPFKKYLFGKAWEQAQFSIGKTEQNLIWETFSEAVSSRGLRPAPYIADQVKHILALVSGKSPGFRPAINNDIAAPISGIQTAIMDVYQLKNYLPTIMHAWPLNALNKEQPIYYSLNLPTLLEGSPVKKSSNTIILDLRDIKQLLDTLKNFAKTHQFLINTMLHNIDVDYFHIEKDMYDEIRSSQCIPDEDTAFLDNKKCFSNRQFCASSLFWRGCLRIKKKCSKDEGSPN
jgi:hypothetical protein